MSISRRSLVFASTLLFISFASQARKHESGNNGINGVNNGEQTVSSRAANCSAPAAYIDMQFNNVKCRIHTGGDMWWDLKGSPLYEIPRGSKKHSIFAGALWMGGLDVNGQLKLAAQRFRGDGNDYWPGPLSSSAEIEAATCNEYDKHYVITRQEVAAFKAWFEMKNGPDADGLNDAFPGYSIPESILKWPAQDFSKGIASLAPFRDLNNDGIYNPEEGGDYPLFEFEDAGECQSKRDEKLYGDQAIWWVFNDKGNIHSESGGASIGMEVHAQAFSFATNDEINDMTFYNYALINKSTFTLKDTYFGVWVDADLGYSHDDYVGCDVQRGLGYCYNGKEIDAQGNSPGVGHYGIQPPAVGVDFFEGPYQDKDGIDNPNKYDYNISKDSLGIPYKGLGIGYGDGIPDNERFGMRRFLYHNNDNSTTGDPSSASNYYNFLRGIWKDNTKMVYGGNGHQNDPKATAFPTEFMFPGDTDPLGFGTGGKVLGVDLNDWTEETEGNLPFDRRFAQSAGPFTLTPGASNAITVGVVWARAIAGGPFASVQKLRLVDDKAQSLFDNCFRLMQGPKAPDLNIVEMDQELILNIMDKSKKIETYREEDFTIPDGMDKEYKFQGYLVFQISDNTVSASDLGNVNKARLVAQCDLKDNVSRLINFKFDDNLKVSVPEDLVIEGLDNGIVHSFQIKEDKFAQGNKELVNFKTYYYMSVSYAYNNYKTYNPNDPFSLDGQKKPYMLSRMNLNGGSISIFKGIPHKSTPKGIELVSSYGNGTEITRIEGQGNGGLNLSFTKDAEDIVLAKGKNEFPTYKAGNGPITVKVIDPLNVRGDSFEIKLNVPTSTNIDTSRWVLTNTNKLEIPKMVSGEETILTYEKGEYIVNSDNTIKLGNEQIITDLGISVSINQAINPGKSTSLDNSTNNGYLTGTVEFSDTKNLWLTGIPDVDGNTGLNWIRSGTYEDQQAPEFNDIAGDTNQVYEKVIGGTWAPFRQTAINDHGPSLSVSGLSGTNKLENLKSVDIVLTPDKNKWTKCVVLENQQNIIFAEGNAKKGFLRSAPSVDKDGKADASTTRKGMGWFPGYAICLETGERLNMAFSEDSWMAGENGRDMIWNPTSTIGAGAFGQDLRMGGKHYIYVFGNERVLASDVTRMPSYDEAEFLYNTLLSGGPTDLRNVYRSCWWVGLPILVPGQKLLSSEVRVQIRVSRAYEKYTTSSTVNSNNPLYQFSLKSLAAKTNDLPTSVSALDIINVVPNPYYAFSEYETDQLDNRIKLINLPEKCQIAIYTANGSLVRKYNKADPSTYLDWDLKNQAGITVAGGIYMIHINVDGVGEKVIKWFGVLRPVDLSTF